jgi:twitching motility protein PilT
LIQAGQKYGMQTMNQSLFHLYTTRQIALGTALSSTRDPDELKRMIEQKSPVLV